MNIYRINKTATELVSLEALKDHLRVEHNAEDNIIKALGQAAYDWVEQFTGRSVLKTYWKFVSQVFKAGSVIEQQLPFPNLLEIESVTHRLSAADQEQPARYTTSQRNSISSIRLISKGAPVEVLYSSGFGPDPSFVPEAFHQSVKILVAHWYQNREGLSCGIPTTVEKFLYPYQILRCA